MIGYVTLGTNDLARAAKFYDALLGQAGAKRMMDTERFISWGVAQGQPMVSLIKPFDGKPATAGNGTMVAFYQDSTAKVDAMYKKVLELGGKDEGPAGPRGPHFYAGYCRDLDGNKISFFTMT